jgi:hypothetical protein
MDVSNITAGAASETTAPTWQPASARPRSADAAGTSRSTRALVPGTLKGSAVRQAARTTADAIRAAFAAFTSTVHPIFNTVVSRTSGVAANVRGIVPRATGGTHGMLRTLEAINTQTSTIRASAPLNLDLSSAPSRLSSDFLGLDVTSPGAVSYLTSAAALGLDLTSPFAASVLRSSAGLGLDLTTPDAASTNESAAALGLDVTSAQAASTLKSSAAIGLDVTSPQSSSTIVSTAPVNTASTTYAPSVSFSSGTTTASLSGTYTGVGAAASTSSLTIKTLTNATIGSSATSVRFQVLDGTTVLLDYTGSIKAGDKVYLGDDIGLFVSFSAGTVVNNASGASAVSHSAPTIDTAAIFNDANANLRPRLDKGAQITAGSFTINGTAIAVNANDSIASVINRINASSAGVTASFANGRLTLTTSSPSEDHIFLANDTSGFLAAMKLAAPNEQINAATTSYGSKSLTFGLGTSVATLSGTYTGIGSFAAATSLTVKVQSGLANLSATSASNLRFVVVDQSNRTLFSFNGLIKAGDKIAIGNDSGLWVSFSTGSLIINESASTTVSTTAGTDVDATATFNNSNVNLRPRFENDAQVTAGSFTVNGTAVAVNANDSINAVLARINSTVSGVTASFANDRIAIVNNAGSNPVVLGNDTSGFLAATKLAAAVTTRGNVRDDQQVLAKTTQFAGVTTGSFSINGTSIAVNKDTDTLSTIVSRINASAAGVTASYDSAQDKVLLTTNANSEDLITVSGDTSGFATAIRLSTANTVRGNIRDDQQILSKATQFGAVATGSFTINGVSIAIDKDVDTLTSIVSRINASAAGVVASYDAARDKVLLTTTGRSEDLIALAGDTTGFLTAAKLSTGNTVRGNIRDDQQVLAKTAQFGSVASGTFTVNGVAIAVNKDTDTLLTVLDRITSSAAGVTATFDTTENRIVLTGKTNSQRLITVAGDATGFLTAGKLQTSNTVRGHADEEGVALADLSAFGPVANGSFVVDGHTIAIDAAQDTIASVVNKINSSGARVVASYDRTLDRLSLTSTYDNEDELPIGSDTSGFLAAAHLDRANTVKGNIRDDEQVLAKTSQFGAVTDGAFRINGATIAVNAAQDSIVSLVARINAANAGVTAAFDAVANRIVLVSVDSSEDTIVVDGDTSGFTAVAGLSTSNTVRGNVPDRGQPLSATARFSSMRAGSFDVNGVSIQVDPTADTLDDLLDRITASAAGVTASYDSAADTLLFTPTIAGSTLSLENDTTGFFAAAGVMTGAAGTHVRANAAFNATGAAGPLFDPGKSVHAGTFTVNGVAIDVAADDSINAVLLKISRSAANVNASYDDAAQTIRLSARTGVAPVVVASDTSGFVAAVKLDHGEQITGTPPVAPYDSALRDVSGYQSVVAGAVTVNGIAFAIDPASTTLRGLVGAVNAAGGIRATLDEASGAITFASTTGGALAVSDTSGVLAAAGIGAGTYRPVAATEIATQVQIGTEVVTNGHDVAAAVRAALDRLNDAVVQFGIGAADRSLLTQLVDVANRSVAKVDSGAGLSVSRTTPSLALVVDERALAGVLSDSNRGPLSDAVAAAMEALGDDAAAAIDQDAADRAAAAKPPVVVWPRPTRKLNDYVSTDVMALNTLLPTVRRQPSVTGTLPDTRKNSAESPFKSLFEVFSEQARGIGDW